MPKLIASIASLAILGSCDDEKAEKPERFGDGGIVPEVHYDGPSETVMAHINVWPVSNTRAFRNG
jgi:hypothetical protein